MPRCDERIIKHLKYAMIAILNVKFADQECQLCEFGWKLIDNTCQFFCGDGLIALHSIEQCDDGNQIENDGYFDCQIECIPNSLFCLNNEVCFMCKDHFYWKINHVYQSVMMALLLLDKSKAQLNQGSHKISNYQLIQVLKKLQQYPYPDTHAAINIKSLVNLSTTFNYTLYSIVVEFIEPIKDPVLQIDIAQLVIKNEQDLDILKNQMKINLGNSFVLSVITQKQKISNIN
ncbi:unnamed protein product [Paramecium sonneborni]|uniref:Uncharacterized protein n=1 Tax=Paramecium sonneborni TaxID=65129 RepID=A0A8S1RCJ9_9CILI|nr:unnamed protein product [Paramecium sonneborni]